MYFKIFRYSKAYFTYLLFLFEPPFQKIVVVNSNVSNYQQEDQLSSPHNSVIYQRLIFSETLIVTGTVFPSLPAHCYFQAVQVYIKAPIFCMMCLCVFHSTVAAHVSVSAETQALSLQALWQSQPNQTGLFLTQPQY